MLVQFVSSGQNFVTKWARKRKVLENILFARSRYRDPGRGSQRYGGPRVLSLDMVDKFIAAGKHLKVKIAFFSNLRSKLIRNYEEKKGRKVKKR